MILFGRKNTDTMGWRRWVEARAHHLTIGMVLLLLPACVTEVPVLTEGNLRFDTYFNDPGTNNYNGVEPIADDRIAELIDSAEKSVYFSFYGFKRQNIVDAVIRAIDRGLDVKFAGDYTHYAIGEEGYVQFERAMIGRPNVQMSVGNSQSIMHNKFLVVDERYVMTGTGNITDSGFTQNNNSWTIIESEDLATDFLNELDQMMRGKYGHEKTLQDNNNVFNVGGVKVELYFSPYEDPMSRFLSAMDEARHSIHYMIFAFTHDAVGRKLIEKHRQGVTVRGVQDRSQFTHSQYVEIYRQAGACGQEELTPEEPECPHPMDVKRDGNENTKVPGDWQGGGGRLHTKTMIVDAGTPQAKVLTGSFNWSPNANENNDENLLVIHSPEIAEQYLAEWQKIYDVGLELPGDQPGYQGVIISEVNWAGTMRKICDPDNPTDCQVYPYDGNEFVELYNNTDRDIDVSYWTLQFPILDKYDEDAFYDRTDSSSFADGPPGESIQKRAFVGFPEGTVIPARSYFIVTEPDQRNDNQNGYLNIDFTPYNELSNFMSLMDRRDGFDDHFNNCSPAFSNFIDDFPSSNDWHLLYDEGAGLRIELRDNRGNLVDRAGDGKKQKTTPEKGGFHDKTTLETNGAPSDASRMWRASDDTAGFDLPTYACGLSADADLYYMVSMERKPAAPDGSFSDGALWDSWDDATRAGENLGEEFRDYTLATPGEKNSNWD